MDTGIKFVLPEIIISVMACFILIIDLFLDKGKKYIIYYMTQFTLLLVVCSLFYLFNESRHSLFSGAFVFDFFKWKIPTHLYIGRVNFLGFDLSSSETKKKIQRGEYDGWDDIRIPFLPALKRRGYQPDAFTRFAVEMGVSQNDKTITGEDYFKSLNAFNKDIIDIKSNRYFFVIEPVEITVENAPEQKVELELHPEDNKRGKRIFKTSTKFYVAKDDYSKFKKGKLYRLMDCLNFKFGEIDKITFDSVEYEHYKEHGEKIMHWLPVSKELVNVEVLMPDKTLRKGLGESLLSKLKEGDIVQLERFGFCRLDKKEKDKLTFWFGHK